jgi:hypothetical protein
MGANADAPQVLASLPLMAIELPLIVTLSLE